jgi:hypothetical protein
VQNGAGVATGSIHADLTSHPIEPEGSICSRWPCSWAYVTCLILAAQQHDSLGAFSGVMLGFVVPITVVTLVVSVSRPSRPKT